MAAQGGENGAEMPPRKALHVQLMPLYAALNVAYGGCKPA